MSARSAARGSSYSADDVQPVGDSLAWIRTHPKMFFRQGRFTATAAVTEIVGEALMCQAVRDVTVERRSDWWIISSRQDWFPSGDTRRLFRQIVPFPEAGANSMRAEVLLAAFCRDVVTQARGERLVIQGSAGDDVLDYLSEKGTEGRIVAFRG